MKILLIFMKTVMFVWADSAFKSRKLRLFSVPMFILIYRVVPQMQILFCILSRNVCIVLRTKSDLSIFMPLLLLFLLLKIVHIHNCCLIRHHGVVMHNTMHKIKMTKYFYKHMDNLISTWNINTKFYYTYYYKYNYDL
jgi:hypothetical protein